MHDWTRVLDDADDKTARLIISMQMEDIQAAAAALGDRVQMQPSDAEVARRMVEAELKDHYAIRAAVAGDEQTEYHAPSNIAGGAESTAPQVLPSVSTKKRKRTPDNDLEEIAPATKCTKQEVNNADAGASKRLRNPDGDERGNVKCETCWEKKSAKQAVALDCGHNSCHDCIQELFQHSMKDETLYPPRCCTQLIELDGVKDILSEDLVAEFTGKREEMEDSSKFYCHVSTCSTYIPHCNRAGNTAVCPACNSSTCRDCKGASHGGDCVHDEETQALLETAKELQWQRCPPCGRFLEHTYGCWHMTCTCKHQFCYLCATTWKQCKCENWNEQRLYNRARNVVRREREGRAEVTRLNARGGRPRILPPINAPQDVAGMAARLRQHADCAHGNMDMRVPGRYQYDDCHDLLFYYIHRYTESRVNLCNRCCMNRRRRAIVGFIHAENPGPTSNVALDAT